MIENPKKFRFLIFWAKISNFDSQNLGFSKVDLIPKNMGKIEKIQNFNFRVFENFKFSKIESGFTK